MADTREAILARLVVVCTGVAGVSAVVRNRLDVAGLARPAVIVQDAIEQMLDRPQGARHAELQRMELSPGLTIVVRGGGSADPGALLSLYRSAILAAVLRDAQLINLCGANGGIRYEGCLVPPPDAEGKEHRIDITLVFTYALVLSDL